MAQHAPHLAELRKKYKSDKQRLNEETMKFYKENGVNPLAGCLPMIPQMIVFFALFYVLRAIAEWKPGATPKYGLTVPVVESAQKATIFGVHLGDKLLFPHTPGMGLVHLRIVIALTVAVSATTTFMTVRQSSKRGLMQTNVDPDNPMAQSQKYMMYIVPFFSLTGLYWQYGLVLYWVTTNLWTLGQQYFMFRNWEHRAAAAGRRGRRAAVARRGPPPSSARRAGGCGRRGRVPRVRPARPGRGRARAANGAKTGRRLRTGSAAGGAQAGAGSGRPGGSGGRCDGRHGRIRSGAHRQRVRPRTGSARGPMAAAASAPADAGRMVRQKRGLLGLGRETGAWPQSRRCPPLRWSGSSRSGRPRASGRASGDRLRRAQWEVRS